MKYLLYTETFPSLDPTSPRQTGIGRYCYDLAVGLATIGQSVTVFTNEGVGTAGATDRDGFRMVARGRFPNSTAQLLLRGSDLREVVRVERPEYVLLGDQAGHQVGSLLWAGLGARYCPIFYGSELRWLEAATGHQELSLKRLAGRYLTGRYLSGAHTRVCISKYAADLLQRVAPEARSDCIVYPCVGQVVLTRPTDPGFAGRLHERLGWDPAPATVLLTVARISERKNQLQVLRGMARLRGSSPHRFRYLIVGNVDDRSHQPYHDELRDYIREHGLDDAVRFIPNASDEEKIDYLDACDVFVMLSQAVGTSVEGFGISTIEASCRGKPVVVSNHGGMPETIIEGRTGYAIAPDDTDRLAALLTRLAADPEERVRMGARGREFARTEFTPEASAQRLQGHLEQHAPRMVSLSSR